MTTNPSDITLAFQAINFIADRYHVTLADIEGHCREWRIVWPRWLAIHLVRTYTSLSWVKIGLLFNRHESVIRFAVAGVENQVQTSCAHGVEVVHLLNAWESTINARIEPPPTGDSGTPKNL